MPTNNLVITDNGLYKVCKELINSRTFDSSLIETEGNVEFKSSDIATNFSTSNYFYYPSLVINSTDLTISANGKFFSSGDTQCLWSLTGSSTSSLYLLFTNTSASLMLGDTTICSLQNISIPNEASIITKVRVTSNTCELQIFANNELFHAVGVATIDTSSFSQITIGTNGEFFWNGYIDMSSVVLSSNAGIVYAPSTDIFFKFTKILVGDGSIPLSENPQPIINHIYEVEIKEITSTGSGIKITGSLGEEASLTIKEIALFDTSNGQTKPFAVASNLSIFKPSSTSYSLSFDIDLSINVVNISGFPQAGDIIVEEIEYLNAHEFDRFRQAHNYEVASMERLIQQNAHELSINTPQQYYRLQQEINSNEEGYNAVENYSVLVDTFTPEYKKEFDENSVELKGNIQVSTEGVPTSFSETDYLINTNIYIDEYPWETMCNFRTNGGTGTILCLSSPCVNQPYELYVENNYCKAKLGGMDSVEVTLNGGTTHTYNRHPFNDFVFDIKALEWENPEEETQLTNTTWNNSSWTRDSRQTYAAWTNDIYSSGNNTVYLNRLTTSETLGNNVFKEIITSSDRLSWTYGSTLDPQYAWSFSIPVEFYGPISNTPRYIVGSGSSRNTFEVYTDSNKKLNFVPYYNIVESRIIGLLTSTQDIQAGYHYDIEVGFTGYEYFLTYLARFISLYAWKYDTHIIYTKSNVLNENITLYNSDWTPYTGTDFVVTEDAGNYTITYNGNATVRSESDDILPPNESEASISEDIRLSSQSSIFWSDSVDMLIGASYDGTTDTYVYPLNGNIENLSRVILKNNYEIIWSAYTPLTTVYTVNYNPEIGAQVFDMYGNPIYSSTVTHLFPSVIFSGNLFRVQPYVDYTVKLTAEYDEENEEYTYVFYNSIDKETFTEIKRIISSSPINEGEYFVIGGFPQYTEFDVTSITNPYTGSVNLLDWYFDENGAVWDMIKEVSLQDAALSQFYHIPKLNLHTYIVNDLCNFSYNLNMLDNSFTGNEDLINFSNEDGTSLLLKVFLEDVDDKVLLVKKNSNNDKYFTLELKNQTLIFTLFTDTSSYIVSKALDVEEYSIFTEYPILLSITFNGSEYNPELKMYRNNTLIGETNSGSGILLDTSNYQLSNSLETEEPKKLYVSDIVLLNGVLSSSDLYKVNNLFDTNF